MRLPCTVDAIDSDPADAATVETYDRIRNRVQQIFADRGCPSTSSG
jgi:hypothetical protein